MRKVKPEKIAQFLGHKDCIYALHTYDDDHFISSGGDGMVVLWSLSNPNQGELLAKVDDSVYAICRVPDKPLILIGHNTQGIHCINVATRKEEKSIHLGNVSVFDICIYNQLAWVACGDGRLVVIDLDIFAVKHTVQCSSKPIRTLALIPDRGFILAGCSDACIYIINMRTLDLVSKKEAHKPSVFTVLSVPEKECIYSGGRDAHIKCWSWQNFSLLQDIPAHLFAINQMVYLQGLDMFASVSMDKSVKIWDADSLQLLKVLDKSRWAGHATSVNKAIWFPGTQVLVTGGDDRTLNLWHIQEESVH